MYQILVFYRERMLNLDFPSFQAAEIAYKNIKAATSSVHIVKLYAN